ncbi:MAG: hypothetical protein KF901_28305 [Myxococcales bacterium]|nr:hypothetical protein [Myxococcales bacterium]
MRASRTRILDLWLIMVGACALAVACGGDDDPSVDAGAHDGGGAADATPNDGGGTTADATIESDAGGGGTTFIGCRGTGSCAPLGMMCVPDIGCEPGYTRSCLVRFNCPTFADSASCTFTGGSFCQWNAETERCAWASDEMRQAQLACPTYTDQDTCASSFCTWFETQNRCEGEWDCARLSMLGTGPRQPSDCAMASLLGITCEPAFE